MSDARSDRPRATGRALLVVASVSIVAAVVLGVISFRSSSSANPSADEVVLDVTGVTAATPPNRLITPDSSRIGEEVAVGGCAGGVTGLRSSGGARTAAAAC